VQAGNGDASDKPFGAEIWVAADQDQESNRHRSKF